MGHQVEVVEVDDTVSRPTPLSLSVSMNWPRMQLNAAWICKMPTFICKHLHFANLVCECPHLLPL
jgi:hypothetical protein